MISIPRLMEKIADRDRPCAISYKMPAYVVDPPNLRILYKFIAIEQYNKRVSVSSSMCYEFVETILDTFAKEHATLCKHFVNTMSEDDYFNALGISKETYLEHMPKLTPEFTRIDGAITIEYHPLYHFDDCSFIAQEPEIDKLFTKVIDILLDILNINVDFTKETLMISPRAIVWALHTLTYMWFSISSRTDIANNLKLNPKQFSQLIMAIVTNFFIIDMITPPIKGTLYKNNGTDGGYLVQYYENGIMTLYGEPYSYLKQSSAIFNDRYRLEDCKAFIVRNLDIRQEYAYISCGDIMETEIQMETSTIDDLIEDL